MASTLEPRSLSQGRRRRARRFARPRALRQRWRRLCDGRAVSGTCGTCPRRGESGAENEDAAWTHRAAVLARVSVLIDVLCRVHGSAPDIEGKNIANPIASIRCVVVVACLLWSLSSSSHSEPVRASLLAFMSCPCPRQATLSCPREPMNVGRVARANIHSRSESIPTPRAPLALLSSLTLRASGPPPSSSPRLGTTAPPRVSPTPSTASCSRAST